MVKSGKHGKKWTKMPQNDPKWPKMTYKNTKITPYNAKHIYMIQNIFYHSSLVQLIAENS